MNLTPAQYEKYQDMKLKACLRDAAKYLSCSLAFRRWVDLVFRESAIQKYLKAKYANKEGEKLSGNLSG